MWQRFVEGLRSLVAKLHWGWQGDNEQCDIEWCDNEHGDNEQKVQILVEMGFAEDDVRGALNETGWNEFLALLMLCAQNTNTK